MGQATWKDATEYQRLYQRMRRFLYRLGHPRKTPGVKPGHKFLFRASRGR